MIDFGARRDKLRRLIAKAQSTSLLVTNGVNVTYLTGFTGHDSYLVVMRDAELLISDPRYEEQIGEECPGLATFIRSPGLILLDATVRVLKRLKLSTLLIEGDTLPVVAFQRLIDGIKATSVGVSSGMVESLRRIKDQYEVAAIRRAIEIAERVFLSVRAGLRGDQTEVDVVNEIERLIRQLGGCGTSFQPIVGVGSRAALPHAVATTKRIEEAPFVLVDWGANERLYRSDLTRVLVTGKISPKFRRIYETVLSAQQAAMDAMRPRVLVSDVDRAARKVIEGAGFGKRFNHGLGHGIGLDIHEAPRIGKNQDQPLEVGMVTTVEPGIYFPGWCGVRIEDNVLVTRDGVERLTRLPRGLEENQVELLNSVNPNIG